MNLPVLLHRGFHLVAIAAFCGGCAAIPNVPRSIGRTHNPAGKEAAPATVEWIAARFADNAVTDDFAALSR